MTRLSFSSWSTALSLELDPRHLSDLSRRDFLRIGAAGVLGGVTPTVYPAAGCAESNDAAQPQGTGRIYLNVSFEPGEDADGGEVFRGIISVDPETGDYRKIGIHGGSVRVSPDRQTLAYSHDDAIWTNNLDGTSPGKVVAASGRPVWTPDGEFLVVSSGKLDDEEERKLPPEKPVWTVETWKYNVLGTARVPLAVPQTDFVHDLSPDGEWVVTSSDRHAPYGRGY